ncbi:hypothetical protein GJU39_09660 [Pedobacter petrophilus]|uniref:Uncharacterized protein n=1 Tax=Pedobacter petrophilus TaxID=1908241 RepID=A0A7K0FXV4_9SPHI|nr:hypothetical protein [Pedobacter petrophilus]MRX76355.1 hypothetical protein [Pedobacter petrophilus]
MEVRKTIELILDGHTLENKEAIISNCEHAFTNPVDYVKNNDLEWLLEDMPGAIMNVAVPMELYEFIFSGDKIDEIHEQIADMYEDFPDFPYDQNLNAKEYFTWLNEHLIAYDEEILLIGDSLSDNLDLISVLKANVDQILELSKAINLICKQPAKDLY